MVPVQFPGLTLGDTGPLPAEALALAANPSKGRPGEGEPGDLGTERNTGGGGITRFSLRPGLSVRAVYFTTAQFYPK